MIETLKVETTSRLYRGAKLLIDGHKPRIVVREGPSWSEGTLTTTIVEVEPTIVRVGEWTIDARVKP